jgi:O-antigen/teichoic acid export membrane protein
VSSSLKEHAPEKRVLENANAACYVAPSRLARNSAYGLVSETWSALVLLIAIPAMVKVMGDAGFGLFSMAWVIIGYLLFLDIGIGRATTKFVSEYLIAFRLEDARDTVRTALVSISIVGSLGGLLVALVMPWAIRLLKIEHALVHDAQVAFIAVAICIPLLLVQSLIRAVLAALQEFGWMALINSAAMSTQWLLAWAVAKRGAGVGGVVVSTVAVRVAATLLLGTVLWCSRPDLLLSGKLRRDAVRRLLHFGSWVTVSQIASPVLVYFDRMLVAGYVSLAAVTFYSVPYEVMTRLRVVPSAVSSTLFPAFSERAAEAGALQRLYSASLRYLVLLLVPVFAILLLYGGDILTLWMGSAFSREASRVLQVMAIGGFMNCLAYVPYSALQAAGRPDLTGKFHLLELAGHIALCFVLIPRWGIVGAAAAGTIRYTFDALLLFIAAGKTSSLRFWSEPMFARTAVLSGALTASLALARFTLGGTQVIVVTIALLLAFGILTWRTLLCGEDKSLIVRVLRLRPGV